MCGHVGCAGQLSMKHEKALKTLLILDSLRGIDGTGVAVIGRDYGVKIAKTVGDPFQLFDNKRFDKAMNGINSVIIGHNRYATQGKVSALNSHPFDFPGVVGAHNGTLSNKWQLDDSKLFDVDSENLFHHINKKGIDDAIKTAAGAWSLVFWDKGEKTLNFIRNKERPLFVTTTSDGALFWASEAWMLSAALGREDIKHEDIFSLPIDTLHTVEVAQNGTLSKPHQRPLESKAVVQNFTKGTNTQAWTGGNVHVPQTHTPAKTVDHAVGKSIDNKGTVDSIQQETSVVKGGTDAKSVPFLGPNPYNRDVDVVLEVVGDGIDKSGSHYYVCRDRKNPNENIRLYKNMRDIGSLMGKFIKCSLHAYRYTDRHGAWHKVEYSSVRPLDNSEGVSVLPVNKQGERMYQDAKGKLITESEWNHKHGSCAYCTGHVDPNQDFRFTTEGETICHLCASDKDVHQYVNLR